MKRSASLPFRILIPLLCFVVTGLCFFISVKLNISDENMKLISDSLSSGETSGQDGSDDNRIRNYIYGAASDNSLSVAEMIGIHHKSDGYISGTPENTEAMLSDGIMNAVNGCYYPIFITAAVAIVLMLAVGIISMFRPCSVVMLIMGISALLSFCGIAAVIILLNTQMIRRLNEYPCFDASSGAVMYFVLAGAVLNVVLCGAYVLMFFVKNGKGRQPAQLSFDADGTLSIRNLPVPEQKPAFVQVPQVTAQNFMPEEPQIYSEPLPTVFCTSGPSAGVKRSFPADGSIKVGRDAETCDIVINSKKISRYHCMISYYPKRKMFAVTDKSINGVYYGKGERLMKDHINLIPAGSLIYLSDHETVLRLELI